MRVTGLDLSLTSTGMSDGTRTEVVQTSPEFGCLEARLDHLVRSVVRFVLSDGGTDLAVIEGASYGSKGSGVEQLSALRLMVRTRLWRLHVPFALVAPATLKLAITGNGRATKAWMVACVDARYGTGFKSVKVKDGRDDRADAFGLAAMGLARVGRPLPVGPGERPITAQSLSAVKWPALLSDD